MSEFACKNNHPMRASQTHCDICGEPVKYMDGMYDKPVKRERQIENERVPRP